MEEHQSNSRILRVSSVFGRCGVAWCTPERPSASLRCPQWGPSIALSQTKLLERMSEALRGKYGGAKHYVVNMVERSITW